MKAVFLRVLVVLCVSACSTVPTPLPQWSPASETAEAEYGPYLKTGTSTIAGQAFLVQQNGGVVRGAGRVVTLDPATSIGTEWWSKAGRLWVYRTFTPPSPGFAQARRTTTADVDGRFKFEQLPAGSYYVRTEVTWQIGGGYNPTQGGLVGQLVEINEGQAKDAILNAFPR